MKTLSTSIELRCNLVEDSLDLFAESTGIFDEDMEIKITDVLANLMHLSDKYELDFDLLINTAQVHYNAEVEIEIGEDPKLEDSSVDIDPELERHSLLTVSTGHISESDRDLMLHLSGNPESELSTCILWFEYGFVIRRITVDCTCITFKNAGFSESLVDLITYAIDQNFDMLEFDRDGPVLDRFNVFDW